MTCKEKLIADNPDWTYEEIRYALEEECPDDYGYVDAPRNSAGHLICTNELCKTCWDREIPNNSHYNNSKEKNMTTNKTKAQLMEELEASENTVKDLKKKLKDLEQYKVYEDAGTEMKNIHTAFMNAGFDNDQAFELIRLMMLTNMANAQAGNTIKMDMSGWYKSYPKSKQR
jgi:hypothetical protein